MTRVTVFDIQRSSYVDGAGIRTAVFFKGCNLRCAWCHNPESQDSKPQLMIYESKCTECGKCRQICPNGLDTCDYCGKCALYCKNDARRVCGKEYTVDEIMQELVKDKSYYDNSGGGVTFSGGECMLQIDALFELLRQCKERGIHTAVDTAGHIPWDSFERILDCTDMFLYDVKCFESVLHKRYTGVDNSLILENLKRLLKAEKAVWVRIPIIPTVNDSVSEMQKIKSFLDTCKPPERIELLPYHSMGEHKYAALGRECIRFQTPTKEKLSEMKKIFVI